MDAINAFTHVVRYIILTRTMMAMNAMTSDAMGIPPKIKSMSVPINATKKAFFNVASLTSANLTLM
jgi:hypothetical protein